MLTAVIVEDEPNNSDLLKGMLTLYFPAQVTVTAQCYSLDEAREQIERNTPDVVFLDIELKSESGFDLLSQTQDRSYMVVFTTAYSNYAVEAFRVNAIDYLLKPIQREELTKTLRKLEEAKTSSGLSGQFELLKKLSALNYQRKIGLPTLQGTIFINIDDIIRCEAEGSYTVFYLTAQKYLISKSLKEVEESLLAFNFFRVHKSHLINLDKVVKYAKTDGASIFLTGGHSVPVSRSIRESLEKRLPIL